MDLWRRKVPQVCPYPAAFTNPGFTTVELVQTLI